MTNCIYPIVEGHGEVRAVPLLIRRILHESLGLYNCTILNPYRVPRSKIGKFDVELLKAIRFGGLKLQENNGGVIVIADADDDCPAKMHEKFIEFYEKHQFNFSVSFVLANREYEAWMISCAEKMTAHELVRNDATSHDQPERVRGAKGFFSREVLVEGKTYSETVDQEKFTAQLDLETALERCRSFRKLVKEIERLSAP